MALEAFVFSPPPCSYTSESFPEVLTWIPRNEVRDGVLWWPAMTQSNSIPITLLQHRQGVYVLVYLHANAEDLGLSHNHIMSLHVWLKVHLICIEYPGYGLSAGSPTEQSVYDDCASVLRFMTHIMGVPEERIILMGRSIGSGVAVKLAKEFSRTNVVERDGEVRTKDSVGTNGEAGLGGQAELHKPDAGDRVHTKDESVNGNNGNGKNENRSATVSSITLEEAHAAADVGKEIEESAYTHEPTKGIGGLVLISAFTRIIDVAEQLAGKFGSYMFSQNLFDTSSLIPYVTCRTLFVHGTDDKLVPSAHSQELYEKCGARRGNKMLHYCTGGGHNDVDLIQDVLPAIVHFFDLWTGEPIKLELPEDLFTTMHAPEVCSGSSLRHLGTLNDRFFGYFR